ncbi:uncharacterized protein EI90DRAFT_3053622 [Cantharellus anzutake]|uniref:uncharacterized protein n=1 Tax=Cantharellus anzutake TaxID=1750568 RepID=UPI001908C300|nr:uncharacterized protein EI90DRAFT_3083730 [Cantharellus anzutake]XP_038916873.1 uncharacterized protein EI90DRAFT_3053622 [Cantharellus anzutake]KAF8318285.1 hypothetical protein EI90DRAFT_3083730 [Cantharellus anzutake]KAF8332579.1 hypothetical protein EI90DRAFT_3053622 [Cantharellus anzutake]
MDACYYKAYSKTERCPWQVYRSGLPLTPSSSPFHEMYGHLSDPIRVFSISGEFSGNLIPLSEDALQARRMMEEGLNELRSKPHRYRINNDYNAEFAQHDVRNGIVTCTTLSQDGCFIALGFGSGVIEVANIHHQKTVSRFQCSTPDPPVWIEFCHGNHKIVTEDRNGRINILNHDTQSVNLGTLPCGHSPAVTTISHSGSIIIRAPTSLDDDWHKSMTLLHVTGDPSIQPLVSPSCAPFTPSVPSTPQRHTLGFSPKDRYVGAYDKNHAFVWSTDSGELITQYHIPDSATWILNTGIVPTCSHLIPEPVLPESVTPSSLDGNVTHAQNSESDSGHKSDESWLKCTFYDLSPSVKDKGMCDEVYSSAAGRVPLIKDSKVWFNGRIEFIIPPSYSPLWQTRYINEEAWYGDRTPYSNAPYLPQASKDGTRWVTQGKMRAPIVIDISQVV